MSVLSVSALPYLFCAFSSSSSCSAASTAPYPSPWRPLHSSRSGTCHARLHSAEVPCARQGSCGSWYLVASPPVQCVYPPLSGRALFFFRYLHNCARDCRVGRPSSWGEPQLPQPSTHPPPIPSFSASPCVSPPPTVCFCRACMCMQFAGWPGSDHRQSLTRCLASTTATARDSDSGSPFRHCPMSL